MFDTTTAAAYRAGATPVAKAQAVRDSLGSGTLTVEIHDGETLKFSGTFTGPMTAGADGSLSRDVVLSGTVSEGGTPNASTWTCKIRNDSGRHIVGSFGPGGRFTSTYGDLVAGQGMRLNVSIAAAGQQLSALAQAAASLSPGQCLRFDTSLAGAHLYYPGDGFDFIQWGSTGVYDPVRKEIGWIGRVQGSGGRPYRWLVYDEATDGWSNDRALWSHETATGHGYDHNTIDPVTGDRYFRVYNEKKVRKWDGSSWTETAAWTPSTTTVGALAWFPDLGGLIYCDNGMVLRYVDGAWQQVGSGSSIGLHSIAEYNSTANVLLYGSGNIETFKKVTAAGVITTVATPPFNIGAGSTQGVCVSDPNSATLIAWQRTSTNWAKYDIATDTWSALVQSIGDGSAPQTGLPNLYSASHRSTIAIEIPVYGVVMFIQDNGPAAAASVWLYKHS